MHNPYKIDVDPHQPHHPDRTRQLGSHLADTVRALNYATRAGAAGLQYPAHAYDLLGTLAPAVGALPQTTHQLSKWITDGITARHFVGPPGSTTAEDHETARELAAHLAIASAHLVAAGESLERAQVSINALRAETTPHGPTTR